MKLPVKIKYQNQLLGMTWTSCWNPQVQDYLLAQVMEEMQAPLSLSCQISLEGPNLLESPQTRFTDSDGGVYGVRFFNYAPGSTRCFLLSPSSNFVWETSEGVAKDFTNSGAVRGHIGFHAAWPTDLENWPETPVDHCTCAVKSLVKGYGDVVIGKVGWRSERMKIIGIQCAEHRAELSAAYPDLTLIIGQPTNQYCDQFKIEWLVPNVDEIFNPRLTKLRMKQRVLAEFS